MSGRYDVIVIGIGAMGSAACRHLAGRGARVLGLEQYGVPHNRGSSHGESRIIRLCYYEHPDYVPLLYRTYEGWERLEAESGEKLMNITGGLYMGEEDGEFIRGTLRSAREHDLPHEAMSRADVVRRFPQFRPPDSYMGVWEPRAGYVRPEAAISALTRRALECGAEVHGHEPVLDWRTDDGGVSVRTARATYRADQLIVTAGAWAGTLLGEIGIELEVTRQVLAWVWPASPQQFAADAFPIWGLDDPDGFFYYGFPLQPERVGLKVARHHQGTATTAETVDRNVTADDEREIRSALQQYVPGADGPVLAMSVCMYTNSPDGHFIIDRHPHEPRVLLAAGFTGHGFKFAPVVGEILADLALDGSTKLPADFLKLARFVSS